MISARCISSNIFKLLLLAVPSVPSVTLMPLSIIWRMGAKPLPSFKFDVGLWMTLTPWAFRMSMSRSVTATQCAAAVGESNVPSDSNHSVGVLP